MGAGETLRTADGSPLDSMVFLVLIIAGAAVLSRRRINWGALFRHNRLLFIFFVYLGIRRLWSDYPFVSFKRWIKDVGNVIMVLVVISDHNPSPAVRFLLARCCYILLPLKIVIHKIFSRAGTCLRSYGRASSFICGVATDKNMLGVSLFACSLVLIWMLLQPDRRRTGIKRRDSNSVLVVDGWHGVLVAAAGAQFDCALLHRRRCPNYLR